MPCHVCEYKFANYATLLNVCFLTSLCTIYTYYSERHSFDLVHYLEYSLSLPLRVFFEILPLKGDATHGATHICTRMHTHTHTHTRIEKTKLPIVKQKTPKKIENSCSLHLWETLLFHNTWDLPFILKLSPKINQINFSRTTEIIFKKFDPRSLSYRHVL